LNVSVFPDKTPSTVTAHVDLLAAAKNSLLTGQF
jgi:hypothetical protein